MVNKSILVAAGILVAASLAFAKFPGFDFGHSSKNPTANLELVQTSRIPGGPTLASGDYKVVLSGNSATSELQFYQNGKLVAQAPAKLVDQGKKFDETEVHYDNRGAHNHVITQMDFSGWKQEVLFGKN
jgi:hypothetical protein